MIQFLDDQVGRFVMRPIVVVHDADVAEFAQERTAARDLDDGTVVAGDGCIHQAPVHGLGLGDFEAAGRLQDMVHGLAVADV